MSLLSFEGFEAAGRSLGSPALYLAWPHFARNQCRREPASGFADAPFSLNFPGGEVPTDLGVTDTRQAVKSAAQSILASSSFCKPPASAPATAEKPTAANPAASSFCKPAQAASAGSSFCNPPAATPRNALCPCRSGAKYKRCCGKNAPPLLSMGAQI